MNPIYVALTFAGLALLHHEGKKAQKRTIKYMEKQILLKKNLLLINRCIFSCSTYEQLEQCVKLINERVLPTNPEMIPDLFDYIQHKEMMIARAQKTEQAEFFRKLYLGTIPKSWVN